MGTLNQPSADSRPDKVIHEMQHAATIYRLITKNEDFIDRTVKQLIAAAQMQISAEVWADNFDKTVQLMTNWCRDRANVIGLLLFNISSDKVVFWIVPLEEEYNFDLGFDQAKLDVELTSQAGIGYCETRQIPFWDLRNFVAPTARTAWMNPVIERAIAAQAQQM